MTTARLSKWMSLFVLFAPMFAQAQMSSISQGAWSATTVSNFADCSTGGVDCWHLTTGAAQSVYASPGHIYVIVSPHVGFTYNDYPSNTWTQHSEWGSVYGLQYGANGNLYGLVGSCGSYGTGHYIAQWTGSKWNNLQSCFKSGISLAPDGGGLFLGIDQWGNLWDGPNYASYLAQCPYPSGHGEVVSVAAINSGGSGSCGNYYLAMADTTIWSYLGGALTQIQGAATQVAQYRNILYVLGTDARVYHYKGNGQWDGLVGAGTTSLAVSGPLNIWRIGPTSNGLNVYRFSETGIQWSRNYQGSVTTNPNCPPGICSTAHHSATTQIETQGRSGAQSQDNFIGPGGWSNTAYANANDVFDCVENGCAPTENVGEMLCSHGGQNHDQPSTPMLRTETAFTRVKVTPGAPYWNPNYQRFYYSNIVPECANTSNPDFNPNAPPGFQVSDTDGHDVNMDISSLGISINGSPWFWLNIGMDDATDANPGREYDPGPTYCTVY